MDLVILDESLCEGLGQLDFEVAMTAADMVTVNPHCTSGGRRAISMPFFFFKVSWVYFF